MLNMQTFYSSLSEQSESRDPYLEAMVALTRADRAQMSAFESDLVWQQWEETSPNLASA